MTTAKALQTVLKQEDESCWRSLRTTANELRLDFTLPTGQTFRWRLVSPGEYSGIIGQRALAMRQDLQTGDLLYKVLARGPQAVPAEDEAVLVDFFNLNVSLQQLSKQWVADQRFRAVHPFFPGARVLRQDPLDCLFQFVCSSNNHISRIHGMVDRLCTAYGTPLTPVASACDDSAAGQEPATHFAFPTLEQLSKATEEELRAAGFGYRAKFITGSVAELMAKPGGGQAWLHSLRQVPYPEASAALCSLPGVGPKVAACVCLFSLDKHQAIPVDTHVWQLATRYYTPNLKGKTLNPKIMVAVEQAFEQAFGSHCGWAHNTLFISELASQRHRLPPALGGTLSAAATGAGEAAVDGSSAALADAASPLPTALRTASILTESTDLDPVMAALPGSAPAAETSAAGKKGRARKVPSGKAKRGRLR
ncbi:hypothetical protein WJX73_005270 [Symbiochloris irregularis]|uniref:DNA-(apurinic or apyrimidinic site) lyase n=1 Tax=Symbiochloris irregularis TaxID=706552 RepID=A0AAW1PAR3_9CHLO